MKHTLADKIQHFILLNKLSKQEAAELTYWQKVLNRKVYTKLLPHCAERAAEREFNKIRDKSLGRP